MELNIKQAFKYLFEDKKWVKKYFMLIGISILMLIPLLNLIAFIPVMLFYAGFMFYLTNSRILKPEIGVPEYAFKKIFKTGLKYFGFAIICAIVSSPVNFVLSSSFSSGKFGLGFFIALILYLLIMIYVDTAFLVFSTNLKFDSFFNFKAIKFILVKNISDYAVYSLIRLGYGIVMTIGVICTLGLLFPLLYFVFADLNAQFIRKIFKIQTKQAQG